MTASIRFKLAVALLLTLALVAVEAAVRAWRWSATPPGGAPKARSGMMKVLPAAGMAPPPPPASVGWIGPTSIDFAAVETLAEAVELVDRELVRGGKADLAALVSEDRVCEALQTGTAAYEAFLTRAEGQGTLSRGYMKYFTGTVKPALLKIAEDRTWPPDCNFNARFMRRRDFDGKSFNQDGFWLGLEIQTKRSSQGYDRFALPIVRVEFGLSEL